MYFMITFELTLKLKCVKQCKQFKYYYEMCLKRQINLTKSGQKDSIHAFLEMED